MSSIDWSNQGLYNLDNLPREDLCTIILDRNFLVNLTSLEKYDNLMKLSAANNRLTDLSGVSMLRNLTTLNLPCNSISKLTGLRNLSKLVWLNLAENKIEVISGLEYNRSLQHLDLSNNNIKCLGDLRGLTRLKTLLLHSNQITTVSGVSSLLPRSVSYLSLAENNISDLNEISNLFHLNKLEQLTIENNPCVSGNNVGFEYRSFVVNWCVNLNTLDDMSVTEREGLKAEWLYSQGKGRHFHPGQHHQLIQYLSAVCTSSPQIEKMEDVKLSRILHQQRLYQQQIQNSISTEASSPHPNHPSQPPTPNQPTRVTNTMTSPGIQDIQNALECETRYLPVLSDLSSSPSSRSDSSKEHSSKEHPSLIPPIKLFDEQISSNSMNEDHVPPSTVPHRSATSLSHPEHAVISSRGPLPSTSRPHTFVPSRRPALSVERTFSADSDTESDATDAIQIVPKMKQSHNHLDRSAAATKLQALWRGYISRKKEPVVVRARQEMRALRSEDHIRYLRKELDRQSELYEQEKYMRSLQVDALKQVWKEVQSLQTWKSRVESSQDQSGLSKSFSNTDLESTATQQLLDILDKVSESNELSKYPMPSKSRLSPKAPKLSSVFQFSSPRLSTSTTKELELENMCRSLQQQVSELKEVLTSITSTPLLGVFSNSISASKDAHTDEVFQGLHLPPTMLRVKKVSSSHVILKWKHPSTTLVDSKLRNDPVLGYRIYLNSEPRGMVASTIDSSNLNGLFPNTMYRVHLRTVGALGESRDSDVLEFNTDAKLVCDKKPAFIVDCSGDKLDPRDDNHLTADENKNFTSHHTVNHPAGPARIDKSALRAAEESHARHINVSKSAFSSPFGSDISRSSFQRKSQNHSDIVRESSTDVVDRRSVTYPFQMNRQEDTAVRPIKTCPLSPSQFSDQLTSTCGSSVKSELFTGGQRTPEAKSDSNGNSPTRLDELKSNEELKFLPKPPDDSLLSRKNSLPRRNSLRHRHQSGVSQNDEGEHSKKTEDRDEASPNPNDTKNEMKLESTEVKGQDERSRSTQSHSKESVRLSSVGAKWRGRRESDTESALLKPPHGNQRDGSVERTSTRRRTQSVNQGENKSSSSESSPKDKNESDSESRWASAKVAKDNSEKTSIFGHKRSKSDAAPVDPSKLQASKDKFQAFGSPPPTSSPTLRRSSSFSKSNTKDDSAESKLRQCISMETLQEAKKSLGMPTRQAGNEPNRGVQQEVGSREEGSTRPAIIVAHNSISEGAAGDRASSITNTYSPRLTMNKSKSGSKIRKASSLFAQLQKKISSHSDNKK